MSASATPLSQEVRNCSAAVRSVRVTLGPERTVSVRNREWARPHGSRHASRCRRAGSLPSPCCPAGLPGRRMRAAGSPTARASSASRPRLPVDGAPRFPGTGLTSEAPVSLVPTPQGQARSQRSAPGTSPEAGGLRKDTGAGRRAPQVAERCFLGYADRVGAESRPSRSLALAAARCGPPVQAASTS